MSKLEMVNSFKEKISSCDYVPEIVSKEDFIRAKTNIGVMYINNTQDAFLYYASLNLLNTYVKQNKGAISYGFKNEVTSGFDSIIMNNIKNVTYDYDKKEGVMIVNVAGMQFAFHNVLPSAKMDFTKNFSNLFERKIYQKQDWEGIRLQKSAETVFAYASHLEGLSNQSIIGNLKKCQDDQVKIEMTDTINL